nr:hypothetical protein [Pyrinomonadaceae bacterium]
GGFICFVVSLALGIASVKLIDFKDVNEVHLPTVEPVPVVPESRIESGEAKLPATRNHLNCFEVESWDSYREQAGLDEKELDALVDEMLPTLPKELRKDRKRLREFLEREFLGENFKPATTRDLLFRTICTDLDGRNKRKKTDR